jgi:CheY-like chemotaxis protein
MTNDKQHESPLTALPGSSVPDLPPRRILLIEDSYDAAQSLRLLLQFEDHEVRVAHNGSDGLTIAREWHPDVVVCDIALPDINGWEVAYELRNDRATNRVHLVALSAYGQEEDQQASRAAGFEAHLTKPVRPDVLLQVLAKLGP